MIGLLPLEELPWKRVSRSQSHGWTSMLALVRNPFMVYLTPLHDDNLFQGIIDHYKYQRKTYILNERIYEKVILVISFKIHQHQDLVLYSLN
jgi:hypothetical protein